MFNDYPFNSRSSSTLLLFISLLFVLTTVQADDLDDGIGIDTPITDDLNLGKNIKFIVRKALARGQSGQDGIDSGSCGSGNIIIGPGSNVREVINVSTNNGTTAICGQ